MANALTYIKNVGKSFAYVTVDVMKEMNPVFSDLAETNEDLVRDMYKSIKEIKGNVKDLPNKVMESQLGKFGKAYVENLFSDITTGKFYNKERADEYEEKAAEQMGGEGFDDSVFNDDEFGDLDNFDFDDDDDGFSSNEMMDIVGEKSSKAVSMAVAKSAEYIVESNAQMSRASYNQMNAIYGGMHSALSTINQNVAKIIEFTTESAVTHINNSSNFFTSATEKLDQIVANTKEIAESVKGTPAQEESKSTTYNTLTSFEGAVDFKKYFDQVWKNLDYATDGMVEIFKSMLEGGTLMTFASNPLEGPLKDFMAETIIKPVAEKAMDNFGKTVSGLFANTLMNLREKAASGDEGPWQFLSDLFGIDVSLKTEVDTSKYEKGKIPFDGITKKSITEVIPTYLSKILSALTGRKENRFDYEKGRFVNVEDIKEEIGRITTDNATRAGSGIRSVINDAIGKIDDEDLPEGITKNDIKETTGELIQNLYKNQKRLNTRDKRLKARDYGIFSDEGQKAFEFIRAVLDGTPENMQYTHKQMRTTTDQANRFKQLEQSTTASSVFNNSTTDEEMVGGVGFNSKLIESNAKIVDTLIDIYQEVLYIRKFGLSRGGGGMPIYGASSQTPTFEEIFGKSSGSKYSDSLRQEEQAKIDQANKAARLKDKTDKESALETAINKANKLKNEMADKKFWKNLNKGKKKENEKELKDTEDQITDLQNKLSKIYKEELKEAQEQAKSLSEQIEQFTKSGATDKVEEATKSLEEVNKNISKLTEKVGEDKSKEETKKKKKYKRASDLGEAIRTGEWDKEKEKEKSAKEKNRPKNTQEVKLDENGDPIIPTNLGEETNQKDDTPTRKSFSERVEEIKQGAIKLAQRPFVIASDLMNKADKRLYTLVFGNVKEDEFELDIDREKSISEKFSEGIEGMFEKLSTFIDEKIIEPLLSKTPWDNLHDAMNKGFTMVFGKSFDDIKDQVKKYLFGDPDAEDERDKDGLLKDVVNGFKDTFTGFKNFFKEAFDETYEDVENLTGYKRKKKTAQELVKEGVEDNKQKINNSGDMALNSEYVNSIMKDTGRIIADGAINRDQQERMKKVSEDAKNFTTGNELADRLVRDDAKGISEAISKFFSNSDDKKDENKPEGEIPNAASGIRKMNKTGLAIVSEGEAIIPPDLNPFNVAKRERAEEAVREQLKRSIDEMPNYAPGTKDASTGEPLTEKDLDKVKSIDEETNLANAMGTTLKNAADASKNVVQKISNNLGLNEKDDKGKTFKDNALEFLSKNTKEYGGALAAGGLIGGGVSLLTGLVGGPLLGAAVGAATALVQKSETVQKALFGEKINGEYQGNFLSKELSNNIHKYLPGMAKTATVGGILAALPFIPGGPIAGIIAGSALGFAKNSQAVQDVLFGDDETTLFGDKEKFKKKLHQVLPRMGVGALAGLIAGPFNPITNILVGSALGFASDTETFKDVIFGEKDEQTGKRTGGIFSSITEPMAEFFEKTYQEFKNFFFEDMVQPVVNAIAPFKKMFNVIGKTITDKIVEGFKNFLFDPLSSGIKRHIIDPLQKTFGGLFKILKNPAKWILSAPSKLIGGVGDFIRGGQIKRGYASYMSAEERNAYRKSRGNIMKIGVRDKYEQFDQQLEKMDSSNLDIAEVALSGIRNSRKDIDKYNKESMKTISSALYNPENKLDGKVADKAMKYIKNRDYEKAIKLLTNTKIKIDPDVRSTLLKMMSEQSARLKTAQMFKDDAGTASSNIVASLEKIGLNIDEDTLKRIAKGDAEAEKLYQMIVRERNYRKKVEGEDDPLLKLNSEEKERHKEKMDLFKDMLATLKEIQNPASTEAVEIRKDLARSNRSNADIVDDYQRRFNFVGGVSENPEVDSHAAPAEDAVYRVGNTARRLNERILTGESLLGNVIQAPWNIAGLGLEMAGRAAVGTAKVGGRVLGVPIGLGKGILGAAYRGAKWLRHTAPVEWLIGDKNKDWQHDVRDVGKRRGYKEDEEETTSTNETTEPQSQEGLLNSKLAFIYRNKFKDKLESGDEEFMNLLLQRYSQTNNVSIDDMISEVDKYSPDQFVSSMQDADKVLATGDINKILESQGFKLGEKSEGNTLNKEDADRLVSLLSKMTAATEAAATAAGIEVPKVDSKDDADSISKKVQDEAKESKDTVVHMTDHGPIEYKKNKDGGLEEDSSSSDNKETERKKEEEEKKQEELTEGIKSIPTSIGSIFASIFGGLFGGKKEGKGILSKLSKFGSPVQLAASAITLFSGLGWAKEHIFPVVKSVWDSHIGPYLNDSWEGKKPGFGKFIYFFNPDNPKGLIKKIGKFVTEDLPGIIKTLGTYVSDGVNWAIREVLPTVIKTAVVNIPTLLGSAVDGILAGVNDLISGRGKSGSAKGIGFNANFNTDQIKSEMEANLDGAKSSSEPVWFDSSVQTIEPVSESQNDIVSTASNQLSSATEQFDKATSTTINNEVFPGLNKNEPINKLSPYSLFNKANPELDVSQPLPKAFEHMNQNYKFAALRSYEKVKDNVIKTNHGEMTVRDILNSDLEFGTDSNGNPVYGYQMLNGADSASSLGIDLTLTKDETKENTKNLNTYGTTVQGTMLDAGVRSLIRGVANNSTGVKTASKFIEATSAGIGKVTPVVGGVVKSGGKATSGLLTKINEIGKKLGGHATAESAEDIVSQAVESAAQSVDNITEAVMENAGDVAEAASEPGFLKGLLDSAKKKVGDAVKGVKNWTGTLLDTWISEIGARIHYFFKDNTIYKHLADLIKRIKGTSDKGIIKKYIDKLGNFIIDNLPPLLKKYGGKLGTKAAAKITAYTASAATLMVVDAVASFISGFGNANTLLGITEEPDLPLKVMAGIIEALNSVFCLGLVPTNMIVNFILEAFESAGLDPFNLQEQRDRAEKELQAFKDETGSNVTLEEYNNKDKWFSKLKTTVKESKVGKWVSSIFNEDQKETTKSNTANGSGINMNITSSAPVVKGSDLVDTQVNKDKTNTMYVASGSGLKPPSNSVIFKNKPMIGRGTAPKKVNEDAEDNIFTKAKNFVVGTAKNTVELLKSEFINNAVECIKNFFNLDTIISIMSRFLHRSRNNTIKVLDKFSNFLTTKLPRILKDKVVWVNPKTLTKVTKYGLTSGVLMVTDAITAFYSGYDNANTLLGIITEPNIQTKILCGFIEVLNSVCCLGLVPISELIDLVIECANSLGLNNFDELEELRKADKKILDKYNKEHNTEYTIEDYNNKDKWYNKLKNDISQSQVGKFFGSAKGSGTKYTAKGSYDTFVSQVDPRYKDKVFNIPGDTQVQTLGDTGCAPAAAAMAINGTAGVTPTTMEQASQNALKFKVKDDGVNATYFNDEFARHGIYANYISSNNAQSRKDEITKQLAFGNKVVLMGQDSGNLTKEHSPFGPNPHYVVANGISEDGKHVYINDPESNTPNIKYGIDKVLGHTSLGISAAVARGTKLAMSKIKKMVGRASLPGATIAEQCWNYFKSEGFSDEATAGILGNLQQESGMDPTRLQNGKGPAAGICQMEKYGDYNSRWGQMAKLAESRGLDWTDLRSQLDFMIQDMPGQFKTYTGRSPHYYKNGEWAWWPEKVTMEDFKKLKDIAKATEIFERVFERASHTLMEKRIKYAKEYYNKFSGKHTPVTANEYSSNTGTTTPTTETTTNNSDTVFGGLAQIYSEFSKLGKSITDQHGLSDKIQGFTEIAKVFGLSNGSPNQTTDESTTSSTAETKDLSQYVSTVSGNVSSNPQNADLQKALVAKMYSVKDKLKYSQSKRDPETGSGDCSSTVQWAYKNILGVDPGSWTGAQMTDSDTYSPTGATVRDESTLQLGDLLLKDGHVEMYAGNGLMIGHGGGKDGKVPGPTVKKLNTNPSKYHTVRRYIGFKGSGSGLGDDSHPTDTPYDNALKHVQQGEFTSLIPQGIKEVDEKTQVAQISNNEFTVAKGSKSKYVARATDMPTANISTQQRVASTSSDMIELVRSILKLLAQVVTNTDQLNNIAKLLGEYMTAVSSSDGSKESKEKATVAKQTLINAMQNTGNQSRQPDPQLMRLIEATERIARE